MDKNEFNSLVDKYSKELMAMAKLSTNSSYTPPAEEIQNIDLIEQDYLEFLKNNPNQGTLKIQANIEDNSKPISDVEIIISKDFENGTKVFYTLKTDINGIIDEIVLPAPEREKDQDEQNKDPYSTYDINATHPQYIEKNYNDIQIFDGMKSIQQIKLIPLIDVDD